ncbi:Chimeric ERCC6-PGBD3 protein [Eumeta japonica]|uniref:Chimeric ERCC6-PGBD3 protein n=2 Tax=Ditrysia TaxID=37567 RepID=A0A4C1VXV0_EUMVA|nr:Chimeric ERCC6-PGBD3 protein [Eumeta japonica]
MASEEFPELLNAHEKQAWLSLKAVIHGFLGNKKVTNYEELISNMLDNFKLMGCRMSLKVHMLHAHLDQFKDNLGAYSEEQGERFHQDVMNFEQRYQGQYIENMMDALENVSDNEEDYRERLICILPPPVDPDCLTDEDSGEEDNVTLNNLPRNILLQPAEVMIQGQIMVSDTEEEPSDSTGRTKRRRTYAWRKRDLAKIPVDEAMIPYYGRHGCKHIKGKPIRYGFKAWVGATRLGYVLWMEPYQGATTMCNPIYKELGLGASVVLTFAMC